MSELPDSWAECTLGDILRYGESHKAEPDEIPEDAWVLELEDIQKDTSRIIERRTFAQRQSRSTKNAFRAGDVLYGKLRPYLNKVIIADADGFSSTEILPFTAPEGIDNRYLFYWLKSPEFLDYVTQVSHGLNMPRLGTKAGNAAPFTLAPYDEQKRIADKLDAVLARVDACREKLERVPAILTQFRQSVLQAATTGELTKDWREERGLEMDWEEVGLADIGTFGRGKSKHRPRNDSRLYGGPYPFIQTGEVSQSTGLITSHSNTYSEFGLQQSKLWPARTLCITIAANIANTSILTYPACFPDSVVGFQEDNAKCFAEFVKWVIDVSRESIDRLAPATAQKNINLQILSEIRFRCPTVEEQREIVRRVTATFDRLQNLQESYERGMGNVGRLPSHILAKAFRGELVPQDLEDEPASSLLGRIKAYKEDYKMAKSPRAKRKQPALQNERLTVELLKKRIEELAAESLTAEELREAVEDTAHTYDEFRDALFQLLEEKEPIILQSFDKNERKMVFKRPTL